MEWKSRLLAAALVVVMVLNCALVMTNELPGTEGSDGTVGPDSWRTEGNLLWKKYMGTLTIIKDPAAESGTMSDYPDGSKEPSWKRTFWHRLTEIVIGEDVENIGQNAFTNATALKRVDMLSASSLTHIGEAAFVGCKSLETVLVPSSLTKIDSSAFEDCESLRCIDLRGTSLISIEDRAFLGCSALLGISLPDSIKQIGDYAFSECESLAYAVMPMSDLEVGEPIFDFSRSLRDVWFTGEHFEISAERCIGDSFATGDWMSCTIHSLYNVAEGMFDITRYYEYMEFTYEPISYEDYDKPLVSYTWKNYDGTVLQRDTDVPGYISTAYTSATPVHKDGMTFCGWKEVEEGDGRITCIAQYQWGPLTDIGGDSGDSDDLGSTGALDFVKGMFAKAVDLFMNLIRGLFEPFILAA